MEEKELELFYDHYKDTFQHLRKYLLQRDKLFFFAILTSFLMIVTTQNLAMTTSITEGLAKSKFGLQSIEINPKLVSTVLLFSFLAILTRYYQMSLLINRQFGYLHSLEDDLSKNLSRYAITRESKGYLEQYPNLLTVVHWIYSLVVPLIVIGIVMIKYIQELRVFKEDYLSVYFISNTLFTILIVVISFLYLGWVHFKDFKKQDNG